MTDKTLHSTVQDTFTLSQFEHKVGEYYQKMTGGKFILNPNNIDEGLTDDNQLPVFDINHLSSSKL